MAALTGPDKLCSSCVEKATSPVGARWTSPVRSACQTQPGVVPSSQDTSRTGHQLVPPRLPSRSPSAGSQLGVPPT
ncbi:hypothetical protein ZHAS_00001486 [Anopheles sinensis]|uniref:Uncharacterized protein n=1 Tax=Anopheles sinensis TaxID=74873 RepID=A0A084VBD9_ANOSI|nr:hypothetical protein ZHAS_00001486 [Anopheles sinensis]